MEPKKNLNNTQRKMLEKIYTERLAKREREFRLERGKQRDELTKKYISAHASKQFKSLIEAGIKYRKLYTESAQALEEAGLTINSGARLGEDPALQFRSYYGFQNEGNKTPQVIKDFDAETQAKAAKIGELSDEIRLRIYGSDTDYASIDAEINEMLKGVL